MDGVHAVHAVAGAVYHVGTSGNVYVLHLTRDSSSVITRSDAVGDEAACAVREVGGSSIRRHSLGLEVVDVLGSSLRVLGDDDAVDWRLPPTTTAFTPASSNTRVLNTSVLKPCWSFSCFDASTPPPPPPHIYQAAVTMLT